MFPVEWQEVVHHAPNGERHIADVRTEHGCVLEFQHSPLEPAERQARESFYQGLVWVVDGARRTRDKPQFLRLVEDATTINPTLWRLRGNLDECALLREWLGSQAQVVFDFGEDDLWLLFLGRGHVYVATSQRADFIQFYRTASGAFAHSFRSAEEAVTTDFSRLRAQDLSDQAQARAKAAIGLQRQLAWRQRSRRRF